MIYCEKCGRYYNLKTPVSTESAPASSEDWEKKYKELLVKALRDALRDALHLQAVNISFLKKAIQAGAPKSELILRCDDIARAALDGST